jgi:hypothetical protein
LIYNYSHPLLLSNTNSEITEITDYRNLTHNNTVEISTSSSMAVTPRQSSEYPWRCTRPAFIARYRDVYLFADSMEVATLDSFFSHLISGEAFKEIEHGLYELLPIKEVDELLKSFRLEYKKLESLGHISLEP